MAVVPPMSLHFKDCKGWSLDLSTLKMTSAASCAQAKFPPADPAKLFTFKVAEGDFQGHHMTTTTTATTTNRTNRTNRTKRTKRTRTIKATKATKATKVTTTNDNNNNSSNNNNSNNNTSNKNKNK